MSMPMAIFNYLYLSLCLFLNLYPYMYLYVCIDALQSAVGTLRTGSRRSRVRRRPGSEGFPGQVADGSLHGCPKNRGYIFVCTYEYVLVYTYIYIHIYIYLYINILNVFVHIVYRFLCLYTYMHTRIYML